MSATTEKTPAEILAELESQIAKRAVEVRGADPETARKIQEAKDSLEYLALEERFNASGKKDQTYAIVDATPYGRGFIVLVTSTKAELHRKTVNHLANKGEFTFDKIAEIVREYVRHPAIETYDETVTLHPDIVMTCWHAVDDLWGARAKIRREK